MGEQHVQYKICSRCELEKSLDEFSGRYSRCKACCNAMQKARYAANPQKYRDKAKAYREANPGKVRERNRRYQQQPGYYHARRISAYGLTPEGYALLLEAQDGRCAICRDAPSSRRLHVDHDHRTGEIRGLLCTRCNVGLGAYRDRPDLLAAAIAYLEADHG